jgi:putative oxidoreductase
MTGKPKIFIEGMAASGYSMPVVKMIELLCGLAFVIGKFVPLAVVLIFPIAVNILLVHVMSLPDGLSIAIPLFLGILFLAFVHRKHYEPLLAA